MFVQCVLLGVSNGKEYQHDVGDGVSFGKFLGSTCDPVGSWWKRHCVYSLKYF